MAKILAYTSPAMGHLFPLVPILLELRSRGHQVHLRTLVGWIDQMRALGLDASPIDPAIEAIPLSDQQARSAAAGLAAAANTFARRGGMDGPDLTRAIAETNPDLVIVDTNAWGARCAAEAWGGPWVAFSPYVPALPSKGTPPFGPGLPPMAGPLGAVRDALVGAAVFGVIERIMMPRIAALRTSLGLEPVTSAESFQLRAPLTLVTTAKPLEYAATDWGASVRMIGASNWEPDKHVPEWLDSIHRPIVLVTTSSEPQRDAELVATALAALADEPLHIVATMPAGVPDDLPATANATIIRFAPHAPLLRRAVAAVTHGGMGATQKALSHGVPVCVVPYGRDQLEVARRVEVSGAGIRFPRGQLRPDHLRRAIHDTIAHVAGARRVQAGLDPSGTARRAADHIETQLLDAPPRVALELAESPH